MNGTEYDNQQATAEQAAHQQRIPGPPAGPDPQAVGAPRRFKSPALATWLSLGPGLGQIYLGYYQQGFINIAIVAGIITVLASGAGGLTPLLAVFLAFYWLYNMIDANRRAVHFNRAMAGLQGEAPPEDFQAPGSGGSMFGGVVLVVVGLLAFLDLKFGISMEWIEDWWPMFLVVGGIYLIAKARRKKA